MELEGFCLVYDLNAPPMFTARTVTTRRIEDDVQIKTEAMYRVYVCFRRINCYIHRLCEAVVSKCGQEQLKRFSHKKLLLQKGWFSIKQIRKGNARINYV